jgi:hypothetical protein
MFVQWLVFIHVLLALTFFLAHGAAPAMVFKVCFETDFARIRAMLDLTVSSLQSLYAFIPDHGAYGADHALPHTHLEQIMDLAVDCFDFVCCDLDGYVAFTM